MFARLPLPLALLTLPILGPSVALAAPPAAYADPAAIERAVASFVAGDPAAAGAVAAPLDARLKLNRCSAELVLSWYGARRDNVRVECPGSPRWQVFVRVSGAAAQEAGPVSYGTPLVLRGEAVSIAVAGDGFTIARSGEALEPGGLGQWIRVRTAPAAAPLRARVSGPGTVELAL